MSAADEWDDDEDDVDLLRADDPRSVEIAQKVAEVLRGVEGRPCQMCGRFYSREGHTGRGRRFCSRTCYLEFCVEHRERRPTTDEARLVHAALAGDADREAALVRGALEALGLTS